MIYKYMAVHNETANLIRRYTKTLPDYEHYDSFRVEDGKIRLIYYIPQAYCVEWEEKHIELNMSEFNSWYLN